MAHCWSCLLCIFPCISSFIWHTRFATGQMFLFSIECFFYLGLLLRILSGTLCFSAGPDAVKYIVCHADVKAIFCVPQTLTSVSLICAPFQATHLEKIAFKALIFFCSHILYMLGMGSLPVLIASKHAIRFCLWWIGWEFKWGLNIYSLTRACSGIQRKDNGLFTFTM